MAEGNPRQEARHDAGLRPGDRRGHGRDRDRGRPVPGRAGEDRRDATATTPCSSRSTPVAERKLTKPELGHLKRSASAPTARSSSSAARSTAPSRARPSRSRCSSRATRSRSPGSAIGKGFQGTIKRHNFRSGPRVARLAQHPQAGLDRRVGDAVARLQGHQDGRPDGRQARHAARADACTRSTPSATCCSSRAPSPARRTASSRCAA